MTSPAHAAASRLPAETDSTFSAPTAALLGLAVLVIHIGTNIITPYGFHRDEFLYLAMGEHLRLWRMDFPPLIAIVARVSHELFGTSLAGIRLAPAFAHAGLVYASVFATSLFGGRRSAQMLAGLSIAFCPLFLRSGAMLQPVVFDQLWWTLALLALTIRIHDNDPKHWAGIGLFLGFAALTKFSVAFIAAGFVVALLITPLRRDLKTKFPWIALIIATILGHPSVTGQFALGWPVFKQFDDLKASQLSHVSPLSFLTGQLSAGPVFFLALGGFFWLLTRPRPTLGNGNVQNFGGPNSQKIGTRSFEDISQPNSHQNSTPDYRPVAVVAGTAFLILLAMRGKAYYVAPIYPVLAAGGAAALDRISVRIAPKRPTKVLAVVGAIVALYGLLGLPFGLPLLAPHEMSLVSAQLGKTNRNNQGEVIPLPQDYADMLGWPELAIATARVWRALPPADTANAILIGTNYGRAGALDLLGRELGLPPSISPVGSYWFFGPGTKSGAVAVVPTDDPASLKNFYSDCKSMATTYNPWGVAEERSVQVYVCRGARATIQEVWPSLAGRN